ncbi:type II secretion system F family protein [Microbacterium immunditiarum]|uniref:Tight adherence protein C n=1 Tax=Microbacterium immunditiarum TaxID=337480 RepID=A0A7Y9GNW8_9MICO|nr:type II secretion system F family protein [Microbacterium immunditiarum]NYE19978.1 tight adherence protein C [Microbacterium immunditiarum]
MSILATDLALAVVLGGAFGVGVCLLLALVPRWGAPSLTRRVAPYLRDITDPRGLVLAPQPFGLRALVREERDRWAARLGGSASIDRRLRQAAWATDAAGFRGRQLVWAVAGVAIGGVLVVALVLLGRAAPAVALLPPLSGAIAAIGCDQLLSLAARRRIERVQDELPTLLEFLALCLSAGEGIFDSIRRVADTGAGELSAELRAVVVAVGTGSSLTDALNRLSRDLGLPALTRSVDQLIAAIERGAPLSDVLHAQALDAREDAKRTLIEQAGRKEIYMLVPLVFLILPLSVLFAVFPGIFMLRLGIG